MPPKPKQLIPADLKVVELRKELSARGLPTKGLKKDLVARLEEALELNNEEQEVDIEDKSSAEPPNDLGIQEQPNSHNSPNNNSVSKPEEVADFIPSNESAMQSATDSEEKFQDINISQINESDNTSIAGQDGGINEKEISHQVNTIEADKKMLEIEAGTQKLDAPGIFIQEPIHEIAKDSLPSQNLLQPVESSDANIHPDLPTTPKIAETADISLSTVNIPFVLDAHVPQTDPTCLGASAYTENVTCTLVEAQSESALIEPESNSEIQTQAPSFDASLASEIISKAPLGQNNSFAASSLDQMQESQSSSTHQMTEVPKQMPGALATQDPQSQTNGSISERLYTSTTESFSMDDAIINITSECQVISEGVPNYGTVQAASVDDKTDISELSSINPSTTSTIMETDNHYHSDKIPMDTGVEVPLDKKLPGAETNLSTFPISPMNGNKVELSGSQEPSNVEKHSPVPTGSQPQPMNPLSSHELSPRAEEEAVFSPSPMPQEEQAYSINANGKPLKFVAITNLTRPFPLSDFEEQLREYGPMDVFWIDKFRSHCYVQYETSAGAIQCQTMLAGVQFPPETGKKLDVVLLDETEGQLLLEKEKASSERFILSIEENKPQLTLYSESRRASVRSVPPTRHASLHEQDSPKQDLPLVQLDEHFCKTSTIPPLYYKPTKELNTPSPEGLAQKRSREASLSDDAHSEANSGSPTHKQARIN